MQTDVVFENLQTGTEYSYHYAFPHLPRQGETLTIWDEAGEALLSGTIATVDWSVADDGYTVFIRVQPE